MKAVNTVFAMDWEMDAEEEAVIGIDAAVLQITLINVNYIFDELPKFKVKSYFAMR